MFEREFDFVIILFYLKLKSCRLEGTDGAPKIPRMSNRSTKLVLNRIISKKFVLMENFVCGSLKKKKALRVAF